MKITSDKKFYKLLFSISVPIAIQNLITFAVSMIDTLMVGSLGEVQLSSVAIANNLFFILMILMFGLAGGSNIMISQYWGKKDVDTIHKILSIMYRVCIVIIVMFIGIAAILPRQFMNIFSNDMAVIEGGASYLRIVSIGYLFYGVTNCTIMMLRGVKTVKISMVVYSASLAVNAFFNWIFIFGKFGFPAMGIQGAAIATVLARIVEFIIILIFMKYFEDKIKLKPKNLMKVDKIILKDFVSTCTPVLFNELLWSTGASMISVIVAELGTSTVAANSINGVAHQFVTVFIFGLSNATAVIIGNTIGEGKKHKAKEYAFTIGVFSILMGLMAGVIVYLIRPLIVELYNVPEATKIIAMEIMSVTSVVVVFQALGVNLMMGVLRGGGDAKFVLINDLVFMWLVAIPGGFIAVRVFNMPIIPVFFIIKSDEIIKSFVAMIRVGSGKWVRDVTRDFSAEIEVQEN
ncbi:MAG: MATE family efflux transporter [Clostridium sp.]|uniref:MATE family efflux transporter n=1 Tax=Clostridium sp. TaxID=1506 RepID=UPI003061DCBD